MRVYTLTIQNSSVSAAQDLFELVTTSSSNLRLLGFLFGQSSDHGDAQAEALRLSVVRGYTTTGSGGSSSTPDPMDATNTMAAAATCKISNTTLATSGTAVILLADVINLQAGYSIWWTPETAPKIGISTRVVVRITAPSDAITVNATLYFAEG